MLCTAMNTSSSSWMVTRGDVVKATGRSLERRFMARAKRRSAGRELTVGESVLVTPRGTREREVSAGSVVALEVQL